MEGDTPFIQIIEDLRKLVMCESIFQLFASTYHIAYHNEEYLVDLEDNSGKIPYELADYTVESNRGDFVLLNGINNKIANINTKEEAGHFLIDLIYKIDTYLAGLGYQLYGNRNSAPAAADNNKRIKRKGYYKPTTTPLGKSYIITPYIRPIYYQWVKDGKLPSREPEYRSRTVANYFFKHHTVFDAAGAVNNIAIKVLNPAHAMSTYSNSLNDSLNLVDNLIIGLAAHDSGFCFDFKISRPVSKHFIKFERITTPDSKTIEENINKVMLESYANKVDIFIFPELTVDSKSLSFIIDWLKKHNTDIRIKLVVAGSAHCDEKKRVTNKSVMLDGYGNIVWEHRKKSNFFMKASEMTDAYQQLAGLTEKVNQYENNNTTYPFTLVDTPIGRMATMICLDYLQDLLQGIFGYVKCGYLWVPAMTPSIGDFEKNAFDPYAKVYWILSAICASISITEIVHSVSTNCSFLQVPVKDTQTRPSASSKGITVGASGLIIYNIKEMVNFMEMVS